MKNNQVNDLVILADVSSYLSQSPSKTIFNISTDIHMIVLGL